MTDAQIEKCHQPFCSCIHKHGYQFTLLCGLRLSRKTRVAAASHFQTIAFIKCEHVNLNEHLGGPSGKNSKVPSFPKPYFATKLHSKILRFEGPIPVLNWLHHGAPFLDPKGPTPKTRHLLAQNDTVQNS